MEKHIEPQPSPVRRIYDSQEVTQHIGRNLIKRSPESLRGRKCGDGRDGQNYMEAIFGSDLGYAFAAQSALRRLGKITPGTEQSAIQSTLKVVAGDGKLYVHTDSHHGNEDTLIGGCGANGVARRNLDKFGLTDTDITAVDATLAQWNSEGKVDRTVYEGEHIEGAVLTVHGRDYGVRAMDAENNTSVFVLQVDLIKDRFTKIAESMGEVYGIAPNTLLEEMMKSWEAQTGIIGKELAHLPDGTPLPSYQVNFQTSGEPVVLSM